MCPKNMVENGGRADLQEASRLPPMWPRSQMAKGPASRRHVRPEGSAIVGRNRAARSLLKIGPTPHLAFGATCAGGHMGINKTLASTVAFSLSANWLLTRCPLIMHSNNKRQESHWSYLERIA